MPLRRLAPLFAFSVAIGAGVACDPAEDEAPECGGDPALVSAGDLPDTAAAGDMMTLAFEVEFFEFSGDGGGHEGHDHGDHDHGDEHEDHGDHDDEKVSVTSEETGCFVGHVHVYLDDLMTDPVAQLTTESGEVMLPADVEAGEHRLIMRLHDATHRIIEPQVVLEHTFTVQ